MSQDAQNIFSVIIWYKYCLKYFPVDKVQTLFIMPTMQFYLFFVAPHFIDVLIRLLM